MNTTDDQMMGGNRRQRVYLDDLSYSSNRQRDPNKSGIFNNSSYN